MAVNPDLAEERAKVSFDREKLTNLLDGGPAGTARKREITSSALDECREKDGPRFYFLSDSEKYQDALRRSLFMWKKKRQLGLTTFDENIWLLNAIFPMDTGPFMIHDGMFVPAIQQHATEEQLARWQKQIDAFEMMGTYAQTELGHGTHLRGLETTVTYDPQTQEFVVSSPTQSSIKWWPGGLGKTANHVLLMAQLVSLGKNLGLHMFLVPIRDVTTHQSLPGVKVGDIGPKLGFNSTDNGYLQFNNVRIPRTNMMMKYSEVRPDGTYIKKSGPDKMSYATMLMVRATITKTVSATCLSHAVTIAIRYSCVRRQSEIRPGEREPQILDYVIQQNKLFPVLAEAFAFHFCGQEMMRVYHQGMDELQTGNGSAIHELHGLSSCLKAFTTSSASRGVEQCRLACGGHGFSQASGFHKIYAQCTAAATYEGENTVLLLQTARYLLKSYGASMSGKPLRKTVVYLGQPRAVSSSITDQVKIDQLLDAFKYLAHRKVEYAAERVKSLLGQGMPPYDVWNAAGLELVKASEAHAQYFVMDTYANVVKGIDDVGVGRVMSSLCQLYGCTCLQKNANTLLEERYMTSEQMAMVVEKVRALLADIRPEAVGLVDAFDLDDHLLGSVLGRHDGRVYEHLYKWAQNAPLNQTDVHSSFNKLILPFREELKNSKL